MFATLLASTALLGAAQFPQTFPVPAGSQPEGIASGPGTTLYVGSRANGSVYRADARTGQGSVLVPGQTGRAAFGLKRSGNRLFVAGGPTGFAYVYNARTGGNVGARDFDGAVINNVTATRRAAHFPHSNKPPLYLYPPGPPPGGPFPPPLTRDLVSRP